MYSVAFSLENEDLIGLGLDVIKKCYCADAWSYPTGSHCVHGTGKILSHNSFNRWPCLIVAGVL